MIAEFKDDIMTQNMLLEELKNSISDSEYTALTQNTLSHISEHNRHTLPEMDHFILYLPVFYLQQTTSFQRNRSLYRNLHKRRNCLPLPL